MSMSRRLSQTKSRMIRKITQFLLKPVYQRRWEDVQVNRAMAKARNNGKRPNLLDMRYNPLANDEDICFFGPEELVEPFYDAINTGYWDEFRRLSKELRR